MSDSTKQPLNEEDFVRELQRVPSIILSANTVNLISLIGLAQLGMRDPQVAATAFQALAWARILIEQIRDQYPPAIQAMIDAGFDPAQDIRCGANPLGGVKP